MKLDSVINLKLFILGMAICFTSSKSMAVFVTTLLATLCMYAGAFTSNHITKCCSIIAVGRGGLIDLIASPWIVKLECMFPYLLTSLTEWSIQVGIGRIQ